MGTGDARDTLGRPAARTMPFMMLNLTTLVCWYVRFDHAHAEPAAASHTPARSRALAR